MTVWKQGNKFAKVWKDEENLRVGFFNEDNTLLEEVPIKDLNNSKPKEIAEHMAESHNIRVQSGHGVDFEVVQGNYKTLEDETNLSEREAELYVLTEELRYNTVQASEKMGISKNNAYGKRGDIKEKIEKAEKTAKLEM